MRRRLSTGQLAPDTGLKEVESAIRFDHLEERRERWSRRFCYQSRAKLVYELKKEFSQFRGATRLDSFLPERGRQGGLNSRGSVRFSVSVKVLNFFTRR